MKAVSYYHGIIAIALIEFFNFTIGNLSLHFVYGLDFAFSPFIVSIVMTLFIVILSYKQLVLAGILTIFVNAFSYWNDASLGITGFSFQHAKLQPIISVWLALFAIAFCVIGAILVRKSNGVV